MRACEVIGSAHVNMLVSALEGLLRPLLWGMSLRRRLLMDADNQQIDL